MTGTMMALTVPCPADYDLVASQRTLRLGPRDPMMRIEGVEVWRAMRAPSGPVTVRAQPVEGGVGQGIALTIWGPGAAWVGEHASDLLGLGDRPHEFRPRHRLLRELVRRHPGLYLPRTRRIFERLVPTVLQQLVTWREAMRAYRGLIERFGEAAPGPGGLRLLPAPSVVARLPDYALVPLGMLAKHARTLRRAAERAAALRRLEWMSPTEARAGLESLPGIGPWTSAWTTAVALGDPDAVMLGDLHLPHDVCWALAGEPRGSDARMMELLAPFAGHRWRVVTLLGHSGVHPPRSARRGPPRPMRPRPRMR